MDDCCGPVYKAAQIACPFYMTDDKFARTLTCEGYDEEHVLLTRFQTYNAKHRHMGQFCCKNFAKCPIYKLVMEERYSD